ncbi:hypothetical protein [Sinomonas susongensis]|uniref:hypothetical protein n=1 Tax=Sinomonas susongensis TaxID=1324851 RepID=UPI001BB20F98|nr:hypothetical protein [Sinomonas susongensis]
MATRISPKSIAAATAISAIGLSVGSIGAMYIAGMFGLSIAFATQIVDAVTVGGWVLAVVMGLLSGGTAAVVIGTARWAISALGRRAAAA